MKFFVFCGFLMTYLCGAVYYFVYWVMPSLDGRSTAHIGADSLTYMGIAKGILHHQLDPLSAAALSVFPNTLWSPVLFTLLFQNVIVIALANCVLFAVSIYLLQHVAPGSWKMFVVLLLLNSTTLVSLLTVNKEIFDLFLVSLFLYATELRSRRLIVLSLGLCLFHRYEVCIVMLVYLFLNSKYNRLRRKHFVSLLLFVLFLSVALPTAGAHLLAGKFTEVSGQSGIVATLDTLELHFLFFIAIAPKILQSLFAELIEFSALSTFGVHDTAGYIILWMNNLANLFLAVLALYKRTLSIRSPIVYFAAIGSVVMGVSMVIQPRYFYFVYVLICLELSRALPVQSYKLRLMPAQLEALAHDRVL